MADSRARPASEGGSICLAHLIVAVWAVGPAILVLQLDL